MVHVNERLIKHYAAGNYKCMTVQMNDVINNSVLKILLRKADTCSLLRGPGQTPQSCIPQCLRHQFRIIRITM